METIPANKKGKTKKVEKSSTFFQRLKDKLKCITNFCRYPSNWDTKTVSEAEDGLTQYTDELDAYLKNIRGK